VIKLRLDDQERRLLDLGTERVTGLARGHGVT
jgi:hypothetical protein